MPRLRALGMLLALALVGCARPVHAPTAHAQALLPPVEVTVLGDSLAYGTGARDSSRGFAFLLYRSLEAERPGSEITNTSIGGSVAADVLRLQVDRLRERDADVVVLCVGGNDVVRGTDPIVFARTYRTIISEIRARAPHALLVAIGVPDISISPLFADRAPIVRALAHADDIAARAEVHAAGGSYVDLFSLTRRERTPTTFLSGDRFHPSDRGHALIAAATLPILRSALKNK